MPQRTRTLELLEHPVRRRALQIVNDTPGIHLQGLVDELDASLGSVEYHVQVLEDEDILEAEHHGKYRCYFLHGAPYDARDRARLVALALPKTAKVIAHLRSDPGAHQSAIADAIDREPSTVHNHVARLEDLGLVEAEPDGNALRYVLDPEPHELEHLPDPAD